MSRPALIISDIDGTIADRGRVSDRTWAAIQAVRAAGIRFAVATGRAAGLLAPVLEHGYDGIAICDNGALTYDAGNDQVLACELIEAMVVGEMASEIAAQYPDLHLGLSRITPNPRAMYSEPRQVEVFDFGQQALHLDEFGMFPAAKIWAVNRELSSSEIGARLAEIAEGRVEVAWSSEGSGLVEMTALGVTKASACAALAHRWGVPAQDVVCMGDMTNDLEMLEWAGTAVVPANGNDAAKARADVLIGHIEEDGTAAYLESLIK
ncbi:HAD-IIB family hydrolase [Cumulibacter manganitolerans]|uniref:HAD-IIB family hydrolase n=1 Tax=Cumulibacter manganitolerans TaxID=1884992 RepID=UPI00188637DA|nr:HAD family hydrolase [Cumulibacter manganitolerans]